MRGLATSFSALLILVSPAIGQFGYGLVGQFDLPAGSSAWDVGADGRAWAIVGQTIYAEGAAGSGSFSVIGSLPAGTVSAFGASFIRVNDSGTTVAVGDNNFGSLARVHFVSSAALSSAGAGGAATMSVPTGNFDGNWNGNQFYLSGSGSDFVPFVSRVSFTDVTGQPVATRMLTGVGGGSGGVAFSGSRIFTGVGFGGSGFATGDIRSFDLQTVEGSAAPVEYSSGTVEAGGPVLSAWPLAFDSAGRLLVGGGDAFGGTTDIGYVAVIDLASGERQLLSPAGTGTTYGVDYNTALQQIYVSDAGTIYRYVIPAPGSGAILLLGAMFAGQRRHRG